MKNVILLLLFVFVISSCKREPYLKFVIPKKDFREILTDIYMVDGYYNINTYNTTSHTQNKNFYTSILKEYGYTMANFDSTLKYYINNTKKFETLYDDVITNLNKLQQENYTLQQYSDTSRNLFKKKTVWDLPKDGTKEMIPFKIAIKDTGMYTIIVKLKVYEDDQAKDPHLTAYFWYADGTKNGHIDYFPFIVYKKSKRFLVLTTNQRNRNKKVTHIKGWVLNHDNEDISFKKHVDVRAIVVTKSNP